MKTRVSLGLTTQALCLSCAADMLSAVVLVVCCLAVQHATASTSFRGWSSGESNSAMRVETSASELLRYTASPSSSHLIELYAKYGEFNVTVAACDTQGQQDDCAGNVGLVAWTSNAHACCDVLTTSEPCSQAIACQHFLCLPDLV